MSIKTVVHLNFSGKAREALVFYNGIFGGKLTTITYRDAGNVQSQQDGDGIMWGQVVSESGFQVMAYDVQPEKPFDPGQNAFYVALRGETVEEVTVLWEGLSVGAEIQHPLQPAAWGPAYGMLKDRFGITWILDVAATVS